MKVLITGASGFLGKRLVERRLVHGRTNLRCMLRDASKGEVLAQIASPLVGRAVRTFSRLP